jgi:hypothetical protein
MQNIQITATATITATSVVMAGVWVAVGSAAVGGTLSSHMTTKAVCPTPTGFGATSM